MVFIRQDLSGYTNDPNFQTNPIWTPPKWMKEKHLILQNRQQPWNSNTTITKKKTQCLEFWTCRWYRFFSTPLRNICIPKEAKHAKQNLVKVTKKKQQKYKKNSKWNIPVNGVLRHLSWLEWGWHENSCAERRVLPKLPSGRRWRLSEELYRRWMSRPS